jgi:hypothetical protein
MVCGSKPQTILSWVEEKAAQFVANEAACFVTLPARPNASTITVALGVALPGKIMREQICSAKDCYVFGRTC